MLVIIQHLEVQNCKNKQIVQSRAQFWPYYNYLPHTSHAGLKFLARHNVYRLHGLSLGYDGFLVFNSECYTRRPLDSHHGILGFIYTRAKAKIFFDLCRCCCRCSINTQIGNNTTGLKWHRFRCSINEPLSSVHTCRLLARFIKTARFCLELFKWWWAKCGQNGLWTNLSLIQWHNAKQKKTGR